MKWAAVAILAISSVGCGLGPDEMIVGDQIVSTQGTALTQGTTAAEANDGGAAQTTTNAQLPVNVGTGPAKAGADVALPQDPIPVYPGNDPTTLMLQALQQSQQKSR